MAKVINGTIVRLHQLKALKVRQEKMKMDIWAQVMPASHLFLSNQLFTAHGICPADYEILLF